MVGSVMKSGDYPYEIFLPCPLDCIRQTYGQVGRLQRRRTCPFGRDVKWAVVAQIVPKNAVSSSCRQLIFSLVNMSEFVVE